MNNEKLKLYAFKFAVFITIAVFIILLMMNKKGKAFSVLFVIGGMLGLISRTNPIQVPKQTSFNFKLSYQKSSILGPLINILMILLGVMMFAVDLN